MFTITRILQDIFAESREYGVAEEDLKKFFPEDDLRWMDVFAVLQSSGTIVQDQETHRWKLAPTPAKPSSRSLLFS
jgi:hypothetical protein